MKIYFSLFISVIFLLSSAGWAQLKLSGKVTEQKSGKFLASVNIFFPELQKGTVTDANGNYEIDDMAEGFFQIEFSYVGYKTQVFPVVMKNENLVLNIIMIPSEVEIGEVVVLGNFVNEVEKAPYRIERVSAKDIKKDGLITLNNSLTLLPGVSELSNGLAISKPVIRGLYGYRTAAIVNGLRFDNQEWQNEHGFGVNEVGVGSIEIVEGPAALLYGANVVGGSVKFVDPAFAPVGKTLGDIDLEAFSNTLGINGILGAKSSGKNWRWQLYLGGQSFADYEDGNEKSISNSRFAGLDVKGILDYNAEWGYSNLSYSFSHHLYGVVEEAELDSSQQIGEEEGREFEGPHHTIDYNIVTSRNLFLSGDSKFKLNVGFQNNHRIEEEGKKVEMMLGKINQVAVDMGELDVILNTFSYDVEWLYPVLEQAELTVGTQGQIQSNENEGGRVLVPNADMNEFSGFVYLKKNFITYLLEGGIRYDFNSIETKEMGVEGEEGYFAQTSRDFNSVNGAMGGSYFPNQNWVIKLNFATGYRAPNLAELASNGVHEGTTRYEIGDQNLESEQNYQFDLGITYITEIAKISVTGFYNLFNNYIYLTPTTDTNDTYSVYRFVQADADLYGGEFSVDLKPTNWLDIIASYSKVTGKQKNDTFLPFMPADKIVATATFIFTDAGIFTNNSCYARLRTYLEQTEVAENETTTPGYSLVDVGIGTTFMIGSTPLNVTLNGTNIFNEVYINNLSLLKPLGVYGIGRNISLALNVPVAFN